MPTLVTLTFNVADLVGDDFDPRRTKIWLEANADTIIDTTGKQIRLGDVKATVGSDGTGSFAGLIATNSADVNPTGFLYRAWIDYQPRSGGGRKVWTSGWFALTGSSDLALAVPVANAPATVTDDSVIASRINDPGSQSSAAVNGRVTAIGDPRWVRKGAQIIDARDHGAVGDGATDDTAAIQAALNVAVANGGDVLLPGPNRTYIATQIVMPYRGSLHIGAGATLRRLATSTETGPLVLIQRHHNKVLGGGTIECLNACPSGVVRVERTDGPCEWARLDNVHIKGPGKATAGSTGLVFSGTATFQNRANGVTISDVETGHRSEGGANMNHLTDVTLYNIGLYVHDLNGTLESSIVGGSVSQAQNTTVFRLRASATYNRIVGFLAEPGTGASFWDIGAGCLENHFIGCTNNVNLLGTDAGTRTTAILNNRTILQGRRTWVGERVRKAANEVVNNSTAYQADDHLLVALDANAEYEFEVFFVYDVSATADAKVKLTVPTGATAHWTTDGGATGATATGSGVWEYRDASQGQALGGAGVGTRLVARLTGSVITGGTAGNLGVEWAQAVAEVSDMTVHGPASRITARRVA